MKKVDLAYELKLKCAAEQDWTTALSSIKDFIVFTDVDGRYEFVNRIIAGLDHTRESILGLSFKDFVPKGYHARIEEVLREVKETKKHGFYRTEGTGPNGKRSYYFTQVSPRIIDDQVIGFVLCSRDVTEEYHEREKWRSLVESCPDIILTVEPNLKVSFINRNFWFNSATENSEGYHLWHFIPESSKKIVFATLERIQEKKSIDGFELKALDKHGKETWYAVTVGPRLRERQVIGYTMVAKDIGPLRYALEEAKKSIKAKTRFLANVSHELRTPLTSIMGHIELLKLRGNDEDYREKSLQVMSKSCTQLLALIEDILELANAEGRRDSVNWALCNPAEVALGVMNQYNRQAKKKGLLMSMSTEPSVPVICLTDSGKLKQILSSLLTNCIKFTARGTISLSIKVEADKIVFDCKDTGVGILPEKFQKIFEPFVQAYDHCDREFSGAGLGLTISRLLAKAINGSLTLQNSQVGSGSHFRLIIPNKQAT